MPPHEWILVVDDNPEIRALLSEIIADAGYAVATAGTGREALERLEDAPPPRVILLDMMMPEMDGWEFCRVRRAREDLARIPIVVLSASAGAAARDPSLAADAVIAKPPDVEALLKIIARCGAAVECPSRAP